MFGLEELAEIRKALTGFAADFDPALLSAAAAEAVVKDAATIINTASTIEALAAKRAADCNTWQHDGSRSPAEHLARQTGIGLGQAREMLETGEHLEELEEVSAAARKGELSPQQAAAVASAAAANPAAEERLLESSKDKSLRELKDECAAAKAAADPDPDATRERIHANRSCRRRRTADGGGEITYRSTLDEVAEIWAVIAGYANAEFKQARAEGRREPYDAYAADGALAMARAAARPAGGDSSGDATDDHGEDAPPPAKPVSPERIIIRIDWESFLRGWPCDDETCEIAGLGPVPVSAVRAMMATGDPFLAAVVTKGKDVVNVAHLGRKPTAHQDTALLWRDPYCTNAACGRVFRLERDHRTDWAHTRITLLSLMDRLCSHDHDLKTRHGWALVHGTGRRAFVPPDDPRHPNNQTADTSQARDGPEEGAA
jgi:hypothetical protein